MSYVVSVSSVLSTHGHVIHGMIICDNSTTTTCYSYPIGHYVRVLGDLGDKSVENEVLLLEHDVPHGPFSEQVLSCLPSMPWTITDEDRARREDLRGLDICSVRDDYFTFGEDSFVQVDPPGCTDIDDALHCRALADGTFEVGVHIADVSHFVRPGTAIDKEVSGWRVERVYNVVFVGSGSWYDGVFV